MSWPCTWHLALPPTPKRKQKQYLRSPNRKFFHRTTKYERNIKIITLQKSKLCRRETSLNHMWAENWDLSSMHQLKITTSKWPADDPTNLQGHIRSYYFKKWAQARTCLGAKIWCRRSHEILTPQSVASKARWVLHELQFCNVMNTSP